ncbi:P-loop containing nucleoside triphosphate hydrolase protein, partial [Pelagophyceae sp. CCMP2097]
RRSLHNTLQELRGNIRVVARLRGDGRRAKGGVTVLASKNAVVVKSPERAGVDGTPRAATKAAFTFDRAFGPAATQADVFEEVAELCQSAMDGYDVCILAYGATGSGKTFTMHGGAARGGPADASDGIVPRACAALAEAQRQLSAAGWNYDVAASCVEVYEERLYDLLADEPVHLAQTQRPGAWGDDDDDARGTYPLLEHATWVQIAADDRSAIEALQARARLARHTSATLLNNRSSRSHAVFTLRLRGEHAGRGETRLGSLVLVDLAGSERVSRSGALADDRQLREACAINKSLSCLVDVFTALGPPAKGATKPKHVPYRNSKLTLLLRRALSGDGKTLLIATLSPDDEELQQTTSTLRFAQHLSSIECGKPTKHATTA